MKSDRVALGLLTGLALALLVAGCHSGGTSAASAGAPPIEARDPWTAVQLVRPAELAAELKAPARPRPLLVHVGFQVLYRGGAIPGSRYLGPGSTADGITALTSAAKAWPRDTSIVLYCGCCPWDHCPNMRPAFAALHDLGFTHVRALYVAKNLDADWAAPGYPIAKPQE